MAGFFFCATNVGSERLVKAEIARLRPDARPAFARPGLVTFKTGATLAPDFALAATFARAWGSSLGAVDALEAARSVGATRLHAWDREGGPAPAVAELRASGLFAPGDVAVAGETVLDVVCAEGEPAWLGWHVHAAAHAPWPGGLVPVELPPEAPSRAFAKIEEAIAWWGAPLHRGETALEIGSAPGGASYALLRRGLSVVGVDPGAMDPIVTANPAFRHVRAAAGAVRREDLPAETHWLLLDVNLAPQVALHAIRRLVPMIRGSLRGAILTLKLNEEGFAAEIPAFLQRVRELGFADARAIQLPSHRSEICVYARRARP
jgi:23S rRNA (cytidine2498-2'-O)-methyltransferase